jgi:hypothetical protein
MEDNNNKLGNGSQEFSSMEDDLNFFVNERPTHKNRKYFVMEPFSNPTRLNREDDLIYFTSILL